MILRFGELLAVIETNLLVCFVNLEVALFLTHIIVALYLSRLSRPGRYSKTSFVLKVKSLSLLRVDVLLTHLKAVEHMLQAVFL